MFYCISQFGGAWIKRRKIVDGAKRIRSEKLKKDQYREGYCRSLEGEESRMDGMEKIMSSTCWSREMDNG